ncbi:MAG: DUF1847 domain-containing protein [Chloroflexota bacterium]
MTARCHECPVFSCRSGHTESAPIDCPMRTSAVVDTRDAYLEASARQMGQVSAQVEAEGYCRWSRLEETIEVARRMSYQRLGIAFCVGLREEAKTLGRVLTANGFQVVSAACKTGSIPKEVLGLAEVNKVRPGVYEAMCNPIGQARLMNEAETDFNIILGLCVGHDSLFIKHSSALVTCLVAKDRALAHNPVGALYCANGYFRDKLHKDHSNP